MTYEIFLSVQLLYNAEAGYLRIALTWCNLPLPQHHLWIPAPTQSANAPQIFAGSDLTSMQGKIF